MSDSKKSPDYKTTVDTNLKEKTINEQLKEVKSQLSPGENSKISKTIETLNVSRKKLDLLKKTLPKSPEIKKFEEEISRLEREEIGLSHFYNLKYKGNDKQKTIIGNNEGPDTLRASDILYLKKTGADLSKLLLIRNGNKLIVNFGVNQSINNIIGAGDIFGPEVKEIMINNLKGIRKNNPRPGFYTAEGKYIPIYDGNKIEILKKGNLEKDELDKEKKLEDERFEKLRLNDMIDGGEFTNLSEDAELSKKVEETKRKRVETRKKWDVYKEYRKDKFLEIFGDVLDRESNNYGIPKETVIKLIEKETGGKFDPNIKNPNSSAYGLGQFLNSTWKEVASYPKLADIDLYRNNPEHQIIAIFAYLDNLKTLKGCPAGEAVVYYHTGPYFGDKHVAEALRVNPAIAGFMKGRDKTAENYMQAAKEFYQV